MTYMKKQMVRGMVAAAVSAACLGNVAFAGELKVWAWDPHFNVAIMEKAASEFEANNEASISRLSITPKPISNKSFIPC